MNIDIFKYIDGQLTPAEKILFEKRLESDPVLQRELEDARDTQQNLQSHASLPDMSHYFLEARTRFHRTAAEAAVLRSRRFDFALPAFSLAVTAFLLMFVLRHASLTASADGPVPRVTDMEVAERIQSLTPETGSLEEIVPEQFRDDPKIDDAFHEELAMTKATARRVISEYDISVEDLAYDIDAVELDALAESILKLQQ